MISFSKESQLQNAPGGNRRKKELSNKEKGDSLEKTVQAAFQSTSKTKVRRNHQGLVGGGLGNPDVSALYGWHLESKNTKTIHIPEWLDQIAEDCPKNHKPALVFVYKATPWIAIKLEDRTNFAADQIEAAGGEVSF